MNTYEVTFTDGSTMRVDADTWTSDDGAYQFARKTNAGTQVHLFTAQAHSVKCVENMMEPAYGNAHPVWAPDPCDVYVPKKVRSVQIHYAGPNIRNDTLRNYSVVCEKIEPNIHGGLPTEVDDNDCHYYVIGYREDWEELYLFFTSRGQEMGLKLFNPDMYNFSGMEA